VCWFLPCNARWSPLVFVFYLIPISICLLLNKDLRNKKEYHSNQNIGEKSPRLIETRFWLDFTYITVKFWIIKLFFLKIIGVSYKFVVILFVNMIKKISNEFEFDSWKKLRIIFLLDLIFIQLNLKTIILTKKILYKNLIKFFDFRIFYVYGYFSHNPQAFLFEHKWQKKRSKRKVMKKMDKYFKHHSYFMN
jgi:hypothetical protein